MDKSDWIKLEDRKPPNGVYVLIANWDNRDKVMMYSVQIACRYNDQWEDDHTGEILNKKYGYVTHWMPLPDDPDKPN